MSHEWGNYPEEFTPAMFWGARALIEYRQRERTYFVSVLPDRQSFEQLADSQMDKEDFIDWINSKVMPAIQEKAKYGYFSKWEDKFELDSESGVFHCEATPKNSFGSYLYIGCWEVPPEDKE